MLAIPTCSLRLWRGCSFVIHEVLLGSVCHAVSTQSSGSTDNPVAFPRCPLHRFSQGFLALGASVTFQQRPKASGRSSQEISWGKQFPDRGESRCKYPKAEKPLACSRSSKDAIGVGVQEWGRQSRREVQRVGGRGQVTHGPVGQDRTFCTVNFIFNLFKVTEWLDQAWMTF